MNALTDLFAAVHAAIAELYPGRVPTRIEIHLLDAQQPISLPLPAASRHSTALDAVFVPNAFQLAILNALEGHALRTDALAAKVGDRSRLFQKPRGGLHELREQGLVKHHHRLGFFRPDAPPEELAGA